MQGTSIDQNFSQTFGYYRCFKDRPTPRQLSKTKSSIYVWEGQEDTKWVKSTDGAPPYLKTNRSLRPLPSLLGTTLPGMRRLCSLQLSGDDIDGVVQRRISRDGVTTWIVRYRVSVRIGGTQLHARIQWEENVRWDSIRVLLPAEFPSRALSTRDQSKSYLALRFESFKGYRGSGE